MINVFLSFSNYAMINYLGNYLVNMEVFFLISSGVNKVALASSSFLYIKINCFLLLMIIEYFFKRFKNMVYFDTSKNLFLLEILLKVNFSTS